MPTVYKVTVAAFDGLSRPGCKARTGLPVGNRTG
jgi:hypothetical protein